MIRILIVDDHAIIREGLRQIIAKADDMTVVAEARNGCEALSYPRHGLDVIILDISMPGLSGLEVLSRIKRENPRVSILILSAYPEELYAVRSLRAGASGYLTKESLPYELLKAIRLAAAGKRYVSASLAERLTVEALCRSDRPLHQNLSAREFQVFRLLSSGKSVREIAGELSLGLPSVSTYRARILAKMKMKHVAELIHYAVRNRLAD
jgi:DNA-binding NarL/FixJ family response regulator